MSSFPDRIDELIRLLGTPASAVNARQGDRVFNLHYSPKEWTQFRQQLHVVPEAEMDKGLIRSTARWPMYMIVVGVLLVIVMVSFWVLP